MSGKLAVLVKLFVNAVCAVGINGDNVGNVDGKVVSETAGSGEYSAHTALYLVIEIIVLVALESLVEVHLFAAEIFLQALESDVVLSVTRRLKLQLHSRAGGEGSHSVIFLYKVPYVDSLTGNGAVNGRKVSCLIGVIYLHILHHSRAVR